MSRELRRIVVKRKNISFKGDKYGHWWTEILDGPDGNPLESYGWWPKNPVGVIDTLVGVEGELNGQTSFGGSPTHDPHQGDSADEEFHPVILDIRTDDEVIDAIRRFAQGYTGEWRWTFGWGQNCHTFQVALMKYAGLQDPR
ncbi:Uncharacterised protein [uncultured archaeon]|nr:Uncharacterised protein [uncultured archaeon]